MRWQKSGVPLLRCKQCGLRLSMRHRVAGNPAGGPGSLKVEPASDAIDVEKFAREIKPGADTAFHGFEVNFGQAHAAASDELIFVEAFPGDLELRVVKLRRETMSSCLA